MTTETPAPDPAPSEDWLIIRSALEIASVIADRVPTRVHDDETAPAALRDIGRLINAQPNGDHGYTVIDAALEIAQAASEWPCPPDYATEINRLRNVIQAACTGGLGHMLERWKELFPDAPVPTVQAFQAPEGAQAASVSVNVLARMSKPENTDQNQQGHQWAKGWNAAIRQAMDYALSAHPGYPTGQKAAEPGPGVVRCPRCWELVTAPTDNNSMGQAGCFPAAERTNAAPAEGDAADRIGKLMTDLADAVYHREVDKVPGIRQAILDAANVQPKGMPFQVARVADLVAKLRDTSGGHINGLYDAQAADMLEEMATLADSDGARDPGMRDAYVGAREDLAIWKRRALEAEELNRKFIADINGQTFMGEPAVPCATPAHATGRWTVISPDGKVFTGESAHRAANEANKHLRATDPAEAQKWADMLDRLRAENEAENERLLAEHGTLDCPACGGSGHIGDVTQPIKDEAKPALQRRALGACLKKLRLAHGLLASDVALLLNFNLAYLLTIEEGRTPITIEAAMAIATWAGELPAHPTPIRPSPAVAHGLLTTEDRTRALNLAYQFRSHPASRGIDDIEQAGELILSLLSAQAPFADIREVVRISDRSHPAWDKVKAWLQTVGDE